jgi:hypothetical protein
MRAAFARAAKGHGKAMGVGGVRQDFEFRTRGGYNVFCTLIDRSLPNVHPYGNLAIRADGKEAINGRHSELLSRRQRCRVRYLSGRPSRVK